MDLTSNLCLTEDGIAELLEEITIYYEDFSSTPPTKRIGDVDKVLFKCRCYCDFKAVPIKRDNIRIFSSIESLSKKYTTVFENYYKKSHEEYLKANRKNNELIRQIFLDYQLKTHVFSKLTDNFLTIKSELLDKNGFLWSNFVDVVTKKVPDFEPRTFLRYGHSFKDLADMQRMKFRFDSANYRVEGKSTIFSNIVLF